MRRIPRFLFMVALIFHVCPTLLSEELQRVGPENAGFDSKRLKRVNLMAASYVDSGKLPGVLTLVARHGQILYLETVGYKDIASKSPLLEDTIFRIYSMTKPITTVAALILFEEGKLQLTDPVSRYIPGFEKVKVLAGDEVGGAEYVDPIRPMTIRDLMTHTAGFTYGAFGDTQVDRMYRDLKLIDGEKSLKEMITELCKIPLLYQPETRWHYSVSVDVLGYLIELVSGEPLDQFFEQRIFRPLDMRDTGFSVPAEKLDRFATCYGLERDKEGKAIKGTLKVLDEPSKTSYAPPVKFLSGGGGLVSTARDYARFLQMLLDEGELDGTRILGRKTVGLMTENHLKGGLLNLEDSKGFGFGLGFAVLLDVPMSGSPGSEGEYNWGGYASTIFWVDPVEDLIAILMTQLIPSGTYPLRADFKSAVYQALID